MDHDKIADLRGQDYAFISLGAVFGVLLILWLVRWIRG